jgi:hypothetical protein
MVVLVAVRLLQIAQAVQAEQAGLAYQGKAFLAVLALELLVFLQQAVAVVEQVQ